MGGGISDWEEKYQIGRRNIRLGGGISDWEEEYKIGRRNIRLGGGISDWERNIRLKGVIQDWEVDIRLGMSDRERSISLGGIPDWEKITVWRDNSKLGGRYQI